MNKFPVRINEVSIDNSIYVNEYYKKNDWIELYNTTSEPIDVAGMYLTDNSKKLTKYQIPANDEANTIIEPFGHLIIWADKLTPLSQLHASFKLDADKSGEVILTASDKSWSDILYYDIHLGTESVGLYPDGSNDVYLMTTPTIGKANVINSYAQWVEQPEDSNLGTVVEITDTEDLVLAYREETLHIYSAMGTKATVTLYDTTGRPCRHLVTELGAGHATINLVTLAQGTYIACVTDSEGNTETLKISKK